MTSTWTILIAAIIMTGASVTLLLRRLISPKAGDAPSGSAENVYHDQLRQLDHEVATGEIRGGEAKVARTEIARRLLSAAGQTAPVAQYRSLRLVSWLIAFLLPFAATAIYLAKGSPTLPSQTLAARGQDAHKVIETISADADVLKRQLATAPQDRAAWIRLASLSRLIGDAAGAAEAYGRALSIQPNDPVLQTLFGEAMVVSSGGTVTKAARNAFELALSLKPGDLTARYYLAMASTQAGDDRSALHQWLTLIQDAPADGPWLPSAQKFLAETMQRLQLSPAPRSQ